MLFPVPCSLFPSIIDMEVEEGLVSNLLIISDSLLLAEL